jgi:hypothetical protein
MIIAGIASICLGVLTFAFGLAPDWVQATIAELIRVPVPAIPDPVLQGIRGASAVVYLGGVVLIAGGLLKNAALGQLGIISHQRSDLEALQNAVLMSLERLETKLGDLEEAKEAKQIASTRMRDLAAAFDRAAAGGED